MKHLKKVISFILIIIVVVFSNEHFAQQTVMKKYMIVKSAPSYILQISGFFDLSALELAGTYNSDFHSSLVTKGETFGTHNGVGASIISKISIAGNSRLWFNQSVSFHRIQSYLLTGIKTNSDKGKANYNSYTGGLGLEYNFSPNYSIKIYGGAELNASLINGSMDIWIPEIGDPYNTESFRILNSFRIGYGLSTGGTYMLSKKIGINFTAKYSCLNVLLKSAEGRDSDREFTLRDGSSKENLIFSGNKNFSFFSVGTGITIYFGIKNKKYKLN